MSSAAVAAMLDAITGELHSFMVVRHGHVIAEGWAAPYSSDRPHLLYSVSKSVTATAVGFARAEGLLDLDDLVLDHFPDLAPAAPSPNLRRMRLRHLLTMTTGHLEGASERAYRQPDWARAILAEPVEHEPGTHFAYNTAATYLLSSAVQRVSGQRVLDYLRPWLLEPLGIEGATFEQSEQGIDNGGSGMSMTTEDLAIFGQLYLQDGVWAGRQVLPVGWAVEATACHVPIGQREESAWSTGYGYQFWRGSHGDFRAYGAFGQYCIVVPDLDLVVATTGAMVVDGELPALWEHLVPGVGEALPPDDDAHAALLARIADLAVPLPMPVRAQAARLSRTATWPSRPPLASGRVPIPSRAVSISSGAAQDASTAMARWPGDEGTCAAVDGRRIDVEPNPWGVRAAVLTVGADADDLVVELDDVTVRIPVGQGDWRAEKVRVGKPFDREVVAAGAWRGPDYELTVRLLGEPHGFTVRAAVDGDRVRVDGEINVAFGGRAIVLVGTIGPRVVGGRHRTRRSPAETFAASPRQTAPANPSWRHASYAATAAAFVRFIERRPGTMGMRSWSVSHGSARTSGGRPVGSGPNSRTSSSAYATSVYARVPCVVNANTRRLSRRALSASQPGWTSTCARSW